MKPLCHTAAIALRGCVLGSCAVGPDFHAPAAPDAQRYTRGEQPASTVAASGVAGIAQSFVTVDRAPQMWWTRFQSNELNRLVNEALQHSPTLAQAHARLTEAQENYNAQAGATLPVQYRTHEWDRGTKMGPRDDPECQRTFAIDWQTWSTLWLLSAATHMRPVSVP